MNEIPSNNRVIDAMRRIIMECENDMNHAYGKLNVLLNTSTHDDGDTILVKVKTIMSDITRLNASYASYAEIFAKVMAQYNGQTKSAEEADSVENDK